MSSLTERLQSMSPERRSYTLRALTTHLERGHESSKLHRLLREYECIEEIATTRRSRRTILLKNLFVRQQQPHTRTRCVNSWFSLQEQEGDAAAFIADVARGRRLAEAESDDEMKRGERGRSLAFQARYALILSSINDLGAGLPPALLARLVEARVWTLTQGLTYARQVPGLNRRALSLAAISGQASGGVKHDILEQALACVQLITDARKRSEALANLAPYLCATLLPQAVSAARAISWAPDRARALIGIARYLSEPLAPEALQEALAAIQKIKDEHSQAESLTMLAACLSMPDREVTMRQVLAKVRASPYDFLKVQLIGAAAQHLPESLLPEALNAARELGMDMDRGNALLPLAPRLAELGRQSEALMLVRNESRPGCDRAQAQALAKMAPYLDEEQLRQAIKIAGKLYSAEDRALAVTGLGPYLSGKLLRRALTIVESMKNAVHQVEPLAVLIRKLPEARREGQFERVILTAIHEYESKDAQFEALARLAPNLPDKLLRLALSESRKIDDERRQVKALARISVALPPEQKADWAHRAILKARGIERERERFEALVYLTPLVVETAGDDEALGIALSIEHPDYCAWALVEVLPRLSQTRRDETLKKLLQSWRRTKHSSMLSDAFKHLAPYLADSLWQEAMAFALENQWVSSRSRMLSSLMRHAPDIERLRTVLPHVLNISEEPTRSEAQAEAAHQLARLGHRAEALDLTLAMADEVRRVEAFEGIIPYLPKPLLLQVLASLEELTSDGRRCSVLADLAPRFAALGEWDVAVQLMRSIEMYSRHALAAARMAEHAPIHDRERIVEHALTIVRNAQGEFEESEDWWQGEALARIAPFIQHTRLEGALELILNIVNPVAREDTLASIATEITHLGPSATYRLWAKVLHHSAEGSRADLLTNLLAMTPVATSLGGPETVEEILQAIDDVGQWWPA